MWGKTLARGADWRQGFKSLCVNTTELIEKGMVSLLKLLDAVHERVWEDS